MLPLLKVVEPLFNNQNWKFMHTSVSDWSSGGLGWIKSASSAYQIWRTFNKLASVKTGSHRNNIKPRRSFCRNTVVRSLVVVVVVVSQLWTLVQTVGHFTNTNNPEIHNLCQGRWGHNRLKHHSDLSILCEKSIKYICLCFSSHLTLNNFNNNL